MDFPHTTALVTGGAGFIGSHIVEELVSLGERVRVLDDFSTGRRENIETWLDIITCIEGDIRDYNAVREAMDGVDYVLHQGALPSVPRSVADPIQSNSVNVDGTLNVLWAARELSVKRVVFACSSSVYGNVTASPKVETLRPSPMSPYAVSKLAGEHYCRAFSEVYGLETVALRYFNVFGPRQDPNSPYSAVIPKFITQLLRGKSPTVHGDGTQSRDFTFVRNVVSANLLACTVPAAAGMTMNVACGCSISLLQLLDKLKSLMDTDVEPMFGPSRDGDVKHSCADISLAQQVMGYRPVVSFDEGLAATVGFFVGEYSKGREWT